MNNNKLTSRPPAKKSIQEFILDAERKEKRIEEKRDIMPWEDNNVRSDVQKVFTLKLPEEYILKIKYVSDITNKSQQKIVREIVCAGIDKQLKKDEI